MEKLNNNPLDFREKTQEIFQTLNKRVNDHFKNLKAPKTGNWQLYLKTVIMFSLLVTPYFLILLSNLNIWIKLVLAIVMGIGMAGVGMNVMHDSNHGSFSKYDWINKTMGASIYLLAGNVHNWKVQHNILHHTYTNIHGHDEDLEAGRIIRFSKHGDWFSFHRFQHYYAVFIYGLLTFNWVISSDFRQISRYLKQKLTYRKKLQPLRQWIILIGTKALYSGIWIIIPLLVMNMAWWQILLGFFSNALYCRINSESLLFN